MRSWKGSNRATISTPGEEFTASMAAPVPRPPAPMTPMRIVSEPAAKRPPEPERAPVSEAIDATEAVLMKSLRVSSLDLSFISLLLLSVSEIIGRAVGLEEGLLAFEPGLAPAVLEAEDAGVALAVDVLEDIAVIHLARARLTPARRIADMERGQLVPAGVA